jgi:predicted dehydrogenase
MIKVGIIGAGYGLDIHISALETVKGVEIVGVSDSGSGRARDKLKDKSLYFESWEKLLSSDIDLVVIATPPDAQLEIVTASITNNKHILCEKPFGCRYKDSEVIVSATTRYKCVKAVNYQFMYEPGIEALAEGLKKGVIGAVNRIDFCWKTSSALTSGKTNSWRNDASRGGGVIGAFLSHIVYLTEWLSESDVKSIRALTKYNNICEGIDEKLLIKQKAEDEVIGSMELTNAMVVGFDVTRCHRDTLGLRISAKGVNGELVYEHRPPFGMYQQKVEFIGRNGSRHIVFDGTNYGGNKIIDTRVIAQTKFSKKLVDTIYGADIGELPDFNIGNKVNRVLEVARKSMGTQLELGNENHQYE